MRRRDRLRTQCVITLVVFIGFAGMQQAWLRPMRCTKLPRAAAPWDGLFQLGQKEPIEVPLSTEEISKQLQDNMLTSIEKALPQMDLELPPGLCLGVEGGPPDTLEPREVLTKEDEAKADRDLAAAYVQMFHALKNNNLCVLFRNNKLAGAAKRQWGDFGKARVVGFPSANALEDSRISLARAIKNRPFVVAVAPKARQLKMLRELSETPDVKMMLIMLNARLRCLPKVDELRARIASASNPVFHVSLVGEQSEGILFRSLGKPWVVVRRSSGAEVLRSDDEPTAEAVRDALATA